MKRSEMITIILDEMSKLHGEQIGHDFEVKLSNLILDRIEKEGMMPPVINAIIPYSGSHELQTLTALIQAFKWEPEDDPMQILADEAQKLKLGYETCDEDPDDDDYCGAV